jgi:hypothetical protein
MEVQVSKPLTTPSQGQSQQSIEILVPLLASENRAERVTAESELLKLAHHSPGERKAVIDQLLLTVRQRPNLDGSHSILSPIDFEYWRAATNLFWQLEATEAIDVMITCIQCGNGYGGIEGDPPAGFALVRMGSLAVPKLSEGLSQERDAYRRIRIVICLSRIGGSPARSALRRALAVEKDKTVKEYLRRVLSGK